MHPTEVHVALHFYTDVLRQHFTKLNCNKVRKDTCNNCDAYKIKIAEELRDQEKTLKDSQTEYLFKAEQGLALPKKTFRIYTKCQYYMYRPAASFAKPQIIGQLSFLTKEKC